MVLNVNLRGFMAKVKVKRELTLEERVSRGALLFDNDPGLTEQSHKDACDINNILATYERTGIAPVMLNAVPRYEDFTQVGDYHTALNAVIAAQDAFMDLPAKVREEFNHDPAEFLAAVEDPSQRSRLIAVGLIKEDPSVGEGKPIVDSKASGEAKTGVS